MCIFHSLENLFHVAAYIQGGGGITFCLQKGEPMRETAYWVGGEIFWATKGEAWERTNPCVWRNMIHNKTEESLEQRPLSDLGGNSRNWGWDIWRGAWRKGWGEECSNILMVFAHITYIWWNLIFFSKNRGSEEVGPASKTRFQPLRFSPGMSDLQRYPLNLCLIKFELDSYVYLFCF